jgi:hypothetical protein
MVDKPIIMQAEEILARGSRDDGSKS